MTASFRWSSCPQPFKKLEIVLQMKGKIDGESFKKHGLCRSSLHSQQACALRSIPLKSFSVKTEQRRYLCLPGVSEHGGQPELQVPEAQRAR